MPWFHYEKKELKPSYNFREVPCQSCDYIARSKKDLHKHKKAKHSY